MDELSLADERVERAYMLDLHDAATPAAREALGLATEEIGGVLVSLASRESSPVLNRAIGLGVESQATHETVQRIIDVFDAARVSRYYVHLHSEAEPPELKDWLAASGLVRARGWMKFRRDLAPPPPPRQSLLSVRRIGPEDAADFGRIAAAAFGLSSGAAGLFEMLADRPRWYLFMSFADDEPAGTGALYVQNGVGWLDWGATDPAHRRKGSQGMVLRRRIEEAARLGCRYLLTETGEAVAGDPQHSYKNIERAGFEAVGLRENYSPS